MMTTVVPLLLQLEHAFGERGVAVAVEVGTRLVEHHQARIAEHRAGKRDPLAITARQDGAALADLVS